MRYRSVHQRTEKFDEFFAKGYLDCVVTTNLNYHTPNLLKRDWYVEADMSKFIAAIINSLNHNVFENALTPTAKIQKLIKLITRDRCNEN